MSVSATSVSGSVVSDNQSQRQLSKAAEDLDIDVVRCEFDDIILQKIIAVCLAAMDKCILQPMQVIMNADEVKFLEREVERTSLVQLATMIKKKLDEDVGPTFHVVYGRSYGLHVSHERTNFCHIKIDGADIVVWKHGE